MKINLTLIIVLISVLTYGQTDNKEFKNLVELGEIYSKNVNTTGDDFKTTVNKLRTENLDHIIDALIAVGQGDKKLLTKEFLDKPNQTELKYWYVLREIHYNNVSEDVEPRQSEIVAKEILDGEIDERWLLDNYYYRIRGGIAKLFNDADLSEYNFDLNDYGLENETERAMLYFALTDAMTQRFKVLQMLNKSDKLLEFAEKLPNFNGKPYYEYQEFDFDDFEWIGYDKTESYKQRHIGNIYLSVNGYFSAFADKKDTENMRSVYLNSVLSEPKYFEYSGEMENDLKDIYNQSKG